MPVVTSASERTYKVHKHIKVPLNALDFMDVILNLINLQQDATYSVYYISVGSSTCFGR